MTSLHHKVATQWLKKQPSVRVASLWISGVCLKVAGRKDDFLNRARQMADYYHNPKLYERAKAIVDSPGHRFEGMEEDDRYHYPNDQRAYDFALRHLDHEKPSEVVGLYRDADAFLNSRSGDVKKQYEKDLRELNFDALKERTPSLANAKDRKSDKEVLYEDDRWRVVVPLSHKSMRGEGTNTKWCISTENTGNACTYRQKDNLHIFVIDKPKAQGGQDAYGKYALTSKGFEGTADVRNTYDHEGPGHNKPLKKAFPAVAEKMGLPDDIRDQVLKAYEEKYPELDARMKEYPRKVESQNIYKGLNADILYGNVLDTASPVELLNLSRSEISPDAKALVKLKQSHAPLRAEIDPQSIPTQLLRALHPSKAPSHLNATQVAKAFEISPKQANEALSVVQKALGDSSSDNRSHSSAKKQRTQEKSFKRWLDGRYEGTGIQNPNPGLKDPIDPDTLLTYAGNSDYEFQRDAIRIKKQLWDLWWRESEKDRETKASQLRDQIRAYKPRNTHPDAKVENPENIGPDALVNKNAVISGDGAVAGKARVIGDAVVSGGGLVSHNAQVTGGEISGKARVEGNAKVSGDAKISGGKVYNNAVVTGGTISGGFFAGKCKIRGGNWGSLTLQIMRSIPEYEEHFKDGALVSGVWDDVPDDVKKKLEEFGPTGQHPDAKVENPKNIGPDASVGKDAVIRDKAKLSRNAVVSGGEISGDAVVDGNAVVTGGEISGNAQVYGKATVRNYAEVKGKISGGSVDGNAQVSGGEISGGVVTDDAVVTGGKISGGDVGDNARVTGGKISGGRVMGDAQISGGEISDGEVKSNAKVSRGKISGGTVSGNAVVNGGEVREDKRRLGGWQRPGKWRRDQRRRGD
jgi:NDP-sugar pyrophosphorylase family protein